MVKSSTAHYSSEKLVNSVEYSHPGILRPVKSFVLKSNNTFASRASNVFSRLSSLEVDHSTWMAKNETLESFESNDTPPDDTPPDTFKKPYLPVSRNRKHRIKKRNMRVWRKYSLKDIPLSSDAKNAAVAFQFLDELRKRKESKICNDVMSHDDKIVFNKPVKGNSVQSTVSSRKEASSCSKAVPNKLLKNIGSSVKLDHLQDESEDNI